MANKLTIYIINVSRNDSKPVPDDQMTQVIQFFEKVKLVLDPVEPSQRCQCIHENTAPGVAVFKAISDTIELKEVTKDKGYWPTSDNSYRFKAMALSYIELANSGTTTQFIVCEKNTALFEHLPKYLAKELSAELIEGNGTHKTQILQIIHENDCENNTIRTSSFPTNN